LSQWVRLKKRKKGKEKKDEREKERQNMTETKVLEIRDAQTIEHDKLPDHARGLIDHSLTMLGDSLTMSFAVLGDCFDHSPTTA
jgi:hypothetical protein